MTQQDNLLNGLRNVSKQPQDTMRKAEELLSLRLRQKVNPPGLNGRKEDKPAERPAARTDASRQSNSQKAKPYNPEEEAGPGNTIGIAVLIVVGMLCAIAPRLGWDSKARGFELPLLALAAVLIATTVAFLRSQNAVDDAAKWSGNGPAIPEYTRRDEGATEQIEQQIDQKPPSPPPSPKQAATPTHMTRQLTEDDDEDEDDLESEDDMWDADWSNLPKKVANPSEEADAEMFSLNDTPTWLARLEGRREQAERAGKKKLVAKIEKEIVEATRQHKMQSVTKGKFPDTTPKTETEDMFESDWAARSEDMLELDISPSTAAQPQAPPH